MKKIIAFSLFTLMIVFVAKAQEMQEPVAEEEPQYELKNAWGIGINGNTMGFGAEIVHAFNNDFALRLGYNFFQLSLETTPFEDQPEIKADNKVKVGGFSLIGEYYIGRKVHLSGGLIYNMLDAESYFYASEPISVSDLVASEEKFGDITIQITPNRIMPYLGLGFGRALSIKKSVSVDFEVGAMYMGQMKVKMTSTGMLTPMASEENEKQIEDNLSALQIYPFATMRLNFKLSK